jgi:predicted ribosomally synthesized peptide with nif11-like leader
MSVKAALGFIQLISEDPELRGQLVELRIEADLEAVARLGAEYGFDFTPDELRAAHQKDWLMRQVYYGSRIHSKPPD